MYRRILSKFKTSRTMGQVIRFVNERAYIGRRIHRGKDGNQLIYHALTSGEPQAIGKLGSHETLALRKYLLTNGKIDAAARSAYYWATYGVVFPADYATYARFCQYMLEEILPEITLMSVWFNLGEPAIVRRSCHSATLLDIFALEPYHLVRPWWEALGGRRVLAVSPFCDTIRHQHPRLNKVWAGTQVMPEFALDCIRVPYHHSLVAQQHRGWFEALETLKAEMSAKLFDVALIGASVYSLPLAVHAKKLGKQGIHLGGATQLFFGILGRRWEKQPEFQRLFNEYWIRPFPSETPPNTSSMENGCYW